MGGKSRKSGGVSKGLIQRLKSGNYKSLKKDETKDTTTDDMPGLDLFGDGEEAECGS